MRNNLVITGAKGFVGQNLLTDLCKKYTISTISRTSDSENEFLWNEINRLPQKSKAYIHLSGKAHDVRGISKAQEYFEVNYELTKKVFESFKKSDSNIFIYFSSVKAAASTVKKVLYEEDLFKIDTPYGQSKRMAEEYLLSQQLKPTQRLYILRPTMIHGPGNKGNMNLLFAMAKKGIPYPLGAFKNERSFLSIDNLIFVINRLLEITPESGIYNVSDDGYFSTTELYNIMGEVLNKNLKVLKLPKFMINSLGNIGDIIPFPLDSLKISKLTENFRVSNQKIKNALDIDKFPLSAKKGLKKTIKSFNQ